MSCWKTGSGSGSGPHAVVYSSVSKCQVSFSLCLGSCLSATKIWNKGLKGLRPQTNCSSVQLKQTDLLLGRHSQDVEAGRPQRSRPPDSSWLPPLYTSVFSSWLCLCKRGLVPTICQWKGMQVSKHSRPVDSCNLRNSRLCCVCLPIIQLVMVSCMYV